MKTLILGFALAAVAVLSVLPAGLGWWADVLAFLRGILPVAAILAGLVLIFTGVSDIKDRFDEKKDASGRSETGKQR